VFQGSAKTHPMFFQLPNPQTRFYFSHSDKTKKKLQNPSKNPKKDHSSHKVAEMF